MANFGRLMINTYRRVVQKPRYHLYATLARQPAGSTSASRKFCPSNSVLPQNVNLNWKYLELEKLGVEKRATRTLLNSQLVLLLRVNRLAVSRPSLGISLSLIRAQMEGPWRGIVLRRLSKNSEPLFSEGKKDLRWFLAQMEIPQIRAISKVRRQLRLKVVSRGQCYSTTLQLFWTVITRVGFIPDPRD